jgi:hypothetical protein
MWKVMFVPTGGTEYVVWSFYSLDQAIRIAQNLWTGHGYYGAILADKPHLTRCSS